MRYISAQLVGVELYFEDLERAKKFYPETLGLHISDEQLGHHAKFVADTAFLCLATNSLELYPSRDKAVLFFEVPDLEAAVDTIGPHRFVPTGPSFTIRKDTTSCSFKPAKVTAICRALSCQFLERMLSWRVSVCASLREGDMTCPTIEQCR